MAPVDGERAQLVLVTGFSLAVTLVVLTLVLNSAIYTGNLASRGHETTTSDALGLRRMAEVGVGATVDSVNANTSGADYAEVKDNYTVAVDNWTTMARRQTVDRGWSLDVSTTVRRNGTRIAQNTSEEFLPRPGQTPAADPLAFSTPNWAVARNVTLRQFEMTVNASTLAEVDTDTVTDPRGDPSSGFFFQINDTNRRWRVGVYNHSAGPREHNVTIVVYKASASTLVGTCNEIDRNVTIDVTGRRVADDECDALSFVEELSENGATHVYFANATDVEGNYSLTVDRIGHGRNESLKDVVDRVNYGDFCSGPTYFDDPAAGSPHATAAIYSVDADTTYNSSRASHTTTDVRIAPDEPSGNATAPMVREFTVDDQSQSGIFPPPASEQAKFEISWTVVDPNADLDYVRVRVVRDPASASPTEVYDTQHDGGGAKYTDSTTVTEQLVSLTHEYDIELTVVDSVGNDRTVTVRHESDGDNNGCLP